MTRKHASTSQASSYNVVESPTLAILFFARPFPYLQDALPDARIDASVGETWRWA